MRWVAERSAEALAGALAAAVPELAGHPIVLPEPVAGDDPQWWSSSAMLADRYVAKFAWSRPAALRLAHEIGVLTALAGEPAMPCLPEVVACSTDPVLLVTRRVPGATLFEVIDSVDRDRAGDHVARFLAALHRPTTRTGVERAVGPLSFPTPAATTTDALRHRLARWIGPDQRRTVLRWCDWADAALATPVPAVLVHGDLHGDNQVWRGGELRLVVDFETAGAAEPEYDLRGLPGTGPGVELLAATMRHYRRATGRDLSVDRVMAWHLRTALGDVLWRSEAGIQLADHRTPPAWVDDVAARLAALGIRA